MAKKEVATVVMAREGEPTHQMSTRSYHDDGPKMIIWIPLGSQKEERHMVVSINDVQWIVEKGKQVEVPQEVGRIINDRLASEGVLYRGKEYVDANNRTGNKE